MPRHASSDIGNSCTNQHQHISSFTTSKTSMHSGSNKAFLRIVKTKRKVFPEPLGSASSCCRSAWSSSSALILIMPAAGSSTLSSYHRPAFISSCCTLYPDIQLSACLTDFRHKLKAYICSINLLQTFCCNYPHVTFTFGKFMMTPVTLPTLKILTWLIWFGP